MKTYIWTTVAVSAGLLLVVSPVQADLQTDLQQATATLQTQQSQLEQLKGEKEQVVAAVAQKKAQMQDLKNKLGSLQVKKVASGQKIRNKIERLNNQKTAVENKIKNSEAATASYKVKLENWSSEVADQKQQVANQEKLVTTQKSQYTQAKKAVGGATAELNGAKATLSQQIKACKPNWLACGATEKTQSGAAKYLAGLQKTVLNKTQNLQTLQTTKQNAGDAKRKAVRKLQKEQTQLKTIKQQKPTAPVSISYSAQLDQLNSQISASTTKLDTLVASQEAAEAENVQIAQEKTQVEEELQTVQTEYKDVVAAKEEYDTQIAATEKAVEDSKKQIENLEKQAKEQGLSITGSSTTQNPETGPATPAVDDQVKLPELSVNQEQGATSKNVPAGLLIVGGLALLVLLGAAGWLMYSNKRTQTTDVEPETALEEPEVDQDDTVFYPEEDLEAYTMAAVVEHKPTLDVNAGRSMPGINERSRF